jgi:copper transport outer membrane protein MctB
VIDFRYHLVSIVAVFLALAIGIVLGSTELQGNTIDLLRSSSNSLKNQLNAASSQRDSYQELTNAGEQYLQTAEPKLLAHLLDGQRVVLITEPGAQSSVVNGIKQAVTDAGATVSGQLALQPAFNDTTGATQSSLNSINGSVANSDGTQLNAGTDPQTADQQQAAQLIATAILEKTANQSGLSATQAQTLLTAYAQAGYLTLPAAVGPVGRATLAVLVTPQNAPSDGAKDPANQVLLAITQQFAAASAATVVAGGTTGSAQPGNAMSALRSSSVSGTVSSVDDADMTLGQITVVDALATQLAGGKPNSYGISGASAVSPNPLPSAAPSATATASAQSHAKATGKGGKPVKNK